MSWNVLRRLGASSIRLGACWTRLGGSWKRLGACCGVLEPSWEGFGGILGWLARSGDSDPPTADVGLLNRPSNTMKN